MPTESDTASTTSLRVQLPSATPLTFVSVQQVPGWTAEVTRTTLDEPVEVYGSTITEVVSEITWTADGAGIRPGEYRSFSISGGPMPGGGSLTLPAIQGYDDGTEVAWIEPTVEGEAEPEHPAPVLDLATAAADDAATTAPAADAGSGGTSGLAVTALVVGVAGLLAGIAGVLLALTARRRTSGPVAASGDREREHVTV